MKSNLRQPGNTTNISDNYATHLNRGSLGGDDLTDPYGTPVHAQLDNATVTIVDNSPDGSGGRYSRVTGPDGDSVESLHQAGITAGRGQRVNADTVIGMSGASAYGSNYGTGGPHIHNHGVRANGVRFNLEPYYWFLSGGSAPADSGNTTPITPEEDMPLNDADLARIEDAIRDQTNDQLKKVWLPAIRAAVNEVVGSYSNAEHQEIAGRIDRVLAPLLRGAGKPTLYQAKGLDPVWAIDTDEGLAYHVENPEMLRFLRRTGVVPTDPPQILDSKADLDRLIKLAGARLAELTA